MTATQISDRIPNMMQTSAALVFGSPVMLGMASAMAVQGYVWRMAMAGPMLAMRSGTKPSEGAETMAVKPKAPVSVAAKPAEAKQAEATRPAAVQAGASKPATPAAQAAPAKQSPATAEKTETSRAKPAASEKTEATTLAPGEAVKTESPEASPATPTKPEATPAPAPVEAVKAETSKATPAQAEVTKTGPETTGAAKPEAPKANAAAPATAEPAPKAVKAEDSPARPPALSAPRGGIGDDLTLLNGVGPKLAEALNDLGIYHFDQVAAWTPAHVAWIDENLGRPTGRASRGGWVEAAAVLAGTA